MRVFVFLCGYKVVNWVFVFGRRWGLWFVCFVLFFVFLFREGVIVGWILKFGWLDGFSILG